LPVIPLLVLPLAGWFTGSRFTTGRAGLSRLLTALVALSVLVQVPGILVDFSKVGSARAIGPRTETQRQWTWEASGLSLNTRASLVALPKNVRYLATGERPPVTPGQSDTRDFSDQFSFSLDFWWVYLFYLRAVSAPVALALGAACLSAAAFCAWRLGLAYRHA
jgi:hypothetical protein